MYIGIDIGGTNTRIGGFSTVGNPEIIFQQTFPTQADYQAGIKQVLETLKKLNGDIEGIGIGLPGIVEEESGNLLKAPNLPGWVNQPLVGNLTSELKLPVKVINDAAAAARGEALFGAYHGQEFLYLIWGTGIGGALIQKTGNTYPIITHFEPGHEILNPDGPQCHCGQRGCLETYCGGRYLPDRFGKPPEDLNDQEWSEVLADLSIGLTNVITLHPTSLIVFGGGIAIKQAQRLPALQQLLHRQLHIFPLPELKLTSLGENAGIYGAISLFEEKFSQPVI